MTNETHAALTTTATGYPGHYACARCDAELDADVTLESGDPHVGVPDGGYVDSPHTVTDDGDVICPDCGAVVKSYDLIVLEQQDAAERWADAMADRGE